MSIHSASRPQTGQSGFSLLEVMISMVILSIGLLAALAALEVTMAANQTSQEDMIARQLASEAMESIFNARNSSQIPFSSIANTTATPPGIFLPTTAPPKCEGPDGILGTADDVPCLDAAGVECPYGGVECITEPGPDGIVGTADDVNLSLNNYTRTITITPLTEGGTTIQTLVEVTITINYTIPGNFGHNKSYVLNEYISEYH
jgi:prepilin-type N-terminal cleavage/methylation domain-containing protein